MGVGGGSGLAEDRVLVAEAKLVSKWKMKSEKMELGGGERVQGGRFMLYFLSLSV